MKNIAVSFFVLAMSATTTAAQAGAKTTLESRWADLASQDESKATRALLALSADPKAALALMHEKLKPVKADAKHVEQLLKQLESVNFSQRQQATMELEYFGKYIQKNLEAALKKNPDLELKRRVEQLLYKMSIWHTLRHPRSGEGITISLVDGKLNVDIDGIPFDPLKTPPAPGRPMAWIRAVRAVTLLEHLATPEAQKLLQAMAAGEADALPTVAAREALERMKK